MKCSRCQHENPSALKFCGECGARLAAVCASCGAANSPEQKFCGECGTKLGADTEKSTLASPDSYTPEHPAENIPTSKSALEGERRQLTVMFCDMMGSTELSQKLDPETLRELMREYQKTCGQVIEKYDGHVAQYLGDGLMVYFGWPRAHEDDAERAIRAGLEIVEAVKQVQAPEPLHVRVGIATGPVVVGETGEGDASVPKLAVGETPNLAARIQGLADSDQIIIGPGTRHLVGGTFDLEDFGEHALKGIVDPVRAWRVSGLARSEGRFDAAHSEGGLTPLVGREQELGLLMERWQLAQDGEGQVVLLSGEPGIGKSRVLSALRERLEGQGAQSLRFQCSPYYVNSAFWPSIDNFERTLKFARDETPESKLDKLESLIVGHYQRPLADVRFIAAMLSISCDERYGELAMTPQKFKDETLRTLVDLTEAAAKKQPRVMLFEDLHWADPTTLEVLELMIDRVKTIPLLIVLTHRPEFQNRWADHGHVVGLNLSKLTRAQSGAIVSRLAGGKELPQELLEQILAKTDGVPLFVEELTKSILESGELKEEADRYEYEGSARSVSIPATLRDSLMARLDRNLPVKEIAQVGAAIGREFSYELIAAAVSLQQAQLDDALAQLTESGLAFRRGTPPEATYTFKHALLQDAAYDSLLKSRRQELHGKIARVIEQRFPETRGTAPEVLAHHLSAAGLSEAAIPLWQKAGELALRRSANVEAINHINRGLALLDALPQTEARDQQELSLQLALGPALMAAGSRTLEMRQAYARARVLGQQLGDTPAHFRALWGLWRSHFVLSELDAAHELGEQCLAVAENSGDDAFRIVARYSLGGTQFMLGDDFAVARRNLESAIALYDVDKHGALGFLYGQDPGPSSLSFLSMLQSLSGIPEQAIRTGRAALDLAKASNHPLTIAMVHMFLAVTYMFSRDWSNVASVATSTIELAEAQGLPQAYTIAATMHGRALVEAGDFDAGILQMEQGIAQRKAIDFRIARLIELALLAEGYGKADRSDDGLHVVAEALDYSEQTGERLYLPELHRLKGELLLHRDAAAAERCFRDAIEVADNQGAQALALRATIDLARLWREQGKTKEAHDLLAPIYGWFSEGFDTADLKDAKALLEELK